MSLERPHSRAGWRARGPPPAPPPTYLWEELRRSRSRGGYPWTILDKDPLPDQLDIELLLKGQVQFITVDEDDERLETESTYERGRHSSRGRKRFRDHRQRITRSRSEPTTNTVPDDAPIDSSGMDHHRRSSQQRGHHASIHSGDSEDFSLNDEDIPDFVMAYLQSDKGNLDEDIPDHILEYIQSRAALLEKNQKYSRHPPADELFYTDDELRIINEARRRLEEQGEFGPADPVLAAAAADDMNTFDDFFARAAAVEQQPEQRPAEDQQQQEQEEEQMECAGAVAPQDEVASEPKKGGGGKFNFKNLSMPSKAQLKLKLPKLRSGGDKKKADDVDVDGAAADEAADAVADAASANKKAKRKQKERRPQSSSPIRQKISQQFETWNANLKRVLPRRSQHDGQVKSFVALLPGRSRSRPAKAGAPENQYEEIGKPRHETECDERANGSYNMENEGEETMEDVENLPESEEVDVALVNPEIVDGEVIDALDNHQQHRAEFVDVEFKDQDQEAADQQKVQEQNVAAEKFGALAARGRQAFEMTKSKIQQTLSKEQLQATRNKLQSTLSKQNLDATRKKVQSTLSPKNLAATGNKLQSTLTNTLKKRKGKKSDISSEPAAAAAEAEADQDQDQEQDRDQEPVALPTSHQPVQESYYDPVEAPTATSRRRSKNKGSVHEINVAAADFGTYLERDQECHNGRLENAEPGVAVAADDEEYEEEQEEEEIEPRMEFTLHQSDRAAPESVDQSTETLPEDVDEEKENNAAAVAVAVVRPSRRRFSNKRRKADAGEERQRPHSIHCESSISSAWPGARPKYPVEYPAVSQEILATFATPINALDAVDGGAGWRSTPDKPPRSRSKKDLHAASDLHLYSNVAPPRRAKKGQDWSTGTWPRKSPSVEYPTAPRRLKPKQNKAPVNNDNQMQTWPRRKRNSAKSPPAAPKRTRSKRKLDGPSEDGDELNDLKKRMHAAEHNILTDPDTLFGVESRYIDDEEMNKKAPPLPDLNQLAEADVLFGDESRFIDEDDSSRKTIPVPDLNLLAEADVLFGDESRFIDEDSGCSNVPAAASTPLPATETKPEQVETPQPDVRTEVMEDIHQQIIPTVRSRKKTADSKKSTDNLSKRDSVSENTWPRSVPTAPIRRKHSIKSQSGDVDHYATLSKTRKEAPPVPVPISTPSEETEPVLQPDEETDASATAKAGIDHLLEILASAFPKEHEPETKANETARVEQQEQQVPVENQYAEINQDKRKGPPRPPPPIYGPEAATTDSYSYIYTVPRRKKHDNRMAKQSASPERPPRTYCTIRPHRPPRRCRTVTETAASSSNIAVEHHARAPALSTETRTRSFSVGDEAKEERDLQSAPVIERMRARPLPPPPRLKRLQSRSPPPKPPRSQSSTLRRRKDSESKDDRRPEDIAIPVVAVPQAQVTETVPERVPSRPLDPVPVVVVTPDEYEPVDEPVVEEPVVVDEPVIEDSVAECPAVEEISIGIQTDPLPEYDDSTADDSKVAETAPCELVECCNQPVCVEPTAETNDFSRPRGLPQGLNNLSFDKADDERKDDQQAKTCETLTFNNIQPPPATCEEPHCAEDEAPKISNIDECQREAPKEEQQCKPVVVEQCQREEPKEEEQCKPAVPPPSDAQPESKPADSDDVKRPPRRHRHHSEDDECDSFSRIPESFAQLTARIPPLRVELPSRLQLSELDVERLNVREVTADRLVVSSVDTNSLQVCQMATSNASGQLVFNLGPGVTLPPLLLAPVSNSETESKHERDTSEKSKKSSDSKAREADSPKADDIAPAQPANEIPQVETATPVEQAPAKPARARAGPARAAPPPVPAPVQVSIAAPVVDAPPTAPSAVPTAAAATAVEQQVVTPLTSTSANQSGEPNLGDLALQLAAVSARRIGSTAVTVVGESYTIAQRVAELGWQQLNEHLQRQGIYFDDKERENVKTVLLMLLLVISAIFLLGPGRTRSINHWDFYFPN